MAAATSGGDRDGRSCGDFVAEARRRLHHQWGNARRWQLPLFLLFCVPLLCACCDLVLASELNNNERPLLLYIPMHVSEPLEHLQELCDRTLSKDPWVMESENKGKDDQTINLFRSVLLMSLLRDWSLS